MEIAITAIGTANPPFKRSQEEAVECVAAGLNLRPAEKRLLKSIYKATGIHSRHSVLEDYTKMPGEYQFLPNTPDAPFPSTAARMKVFQEQALPLALKAIEDCFANIESFDPQTITHLIIVSCTGMYAPGIDIEITQHLNLRSTIKRTTVHFMGCYGVFNGLKVAESICRAEPSATVLLVSVELCTIHLQNSSKSDDLIANSIFADGAAAALIQAQPSLKKYFAFDTFHCDLLPQTNQEMAWRISDHGFDMILSAYVPNIIEAGIATFIQKLLNQSDILSSIDLYAIHPGGLKILQACEKALAITKEDNKYAYDVLKKYGNMSSATILFVLKTIWDDVNVAHHDKTIFGCAFGPGLTLESMLLKTHCA